MGLVSEGGSGLVSVRVSDHVSELATEQVSVCAKAHLSRVLVSAPVSEALSD